MDVSFGTDGWRTTVEEFTTPRIHGVGQAVVDYLREADATAPVAVGYDPRESSRPAAEELCRVLCAGGFDAVLADRDTPTPVVGWTVTENGYAGALQVTASHNPASYNGIKFIPADGAPALPGVTERLAENIRPPEPRSRAEWGRIRERDLVDQYLDHAASFVDADLEGAQVAYDAMHGSGRGVTDALLERAGADVERLRCEDDPEFGGTPPEPSGARLRELESRVGSDAAELGIANDGDADRIAAVTPEHGYVDPNLLFAVLYDYLLDDESGDAVRTVSTTFLIDRIAEASGEAVHETPVGFKYVAETMAEHDALIGGEESGGYGVRGHLRNKDGVLLALLVAAADAEEPIDDRLDRIRARYGDIVQDRTSVECPDERKVAVLDLLGGEIPESVAGVAVESVGTADGFKLLLADGSWLLVRPSGTEPKLRVYAEAESRARIDELLTAGEKLVRPLV